MRDHEYDRRGLELATVDPKGVATQRLFNEANQPFAVATGDWVRGGNDFSLGSSPNGVTKSLLYFDANGNAVLKKELNDNPDTSGIAPYIETQYVYDGLDRLVETDAMLVTPGSPAVAWVKTFWIRDELGRLIRQINTDGTAVSASYTYQGAVSEKRHHAQKYSLNANGEPVGAESPLPADAADRLHTLTYAPDNKLVSVQDGTGAIATLHYDGFRRRVSRTDPASTRLMRELDAKGNVTSEVIAANLGNGPELKRTEYVYDELSRPVERREMWSDDLGNPISDHWVTTRYGYDLAGELIKERDDAGNDQDCEYDAAGRATHRRYPADLNAPGTRDHDDSVYDANGNVTELHVVEYGPDGTPVTLELHTEFDDLNRAIRTIQGPTTGTPAVRETWYDSLGNVIKTVRPGSVGRVGTRFKVDTQKRMVQSIDGYNEQFTGPIDPTNSGDGLVTLTKVYDTYGHLLAEVDDVASTHATTYQYDNLHRKVRVTYADDTYETIQYRPDDLPDSFRAFDELGTQLFEVDHVYDGAKRKTAELYNMNAAAPFTGLSGKSWSHDPLGRITNSWALNKHPLYPDRDLLTHTSYKYDSLGRALEESQELVQIVSGVPTTLHSHTITGTWDAFGNKTVTASSQGTDPGGFRIERAFDAVQRLREVEEIRTTGPAITAAIRWQGARGRIRDISHWNGVTTYHDQYDGRGRVGQIRTQAAGGAVLDGRFFGYTPSSVRSRELKLGPVGQDYVFEHDVFERLVKVRKGEWDGGSGGLVGTVQLTKRTFDGANSMTLREEGIEGEPLTVTPATTDTTNAYTNFGALAVLRDKRGNTTQIGNEFLSYDILGHQVCWTDNVQAPTNIWYEAYDAEDRRIYREDIAGARRSFIWDRQVLLQEKNLAAGVVDREYVYGAGVDAVVGQRVGGVPYAFHTDNLSTPYAATDAAGAVAEHYDVEAFGQLTSTPGPGYGQSLGSHVGLHGGWRDPTNGRIYFRQRVYDPDLARFLSRDPLGVWGDALNLGGAFAFAANTPTLVRDPTGLDSVILVTWFAPEKSGYWSTNSSPAFGEEVAKSLTAAGASVKTLAISVDWKTAQKQLTDKITEIKGADPNARITVLALGQGGEFKLEKEARNERGRHMDPRGFTPDPDRPGYLNDESPGAKPQYRAPSSADEVAQNLGIPTSKNAGQFLCEAVAYEVYKQVSTGGIESGFFIHVPADPTEKQIGDFGKRVGETFGPKALPESKPLRVKGGTVGGYSELQ